MIVSFKHKGLELFFKIGDKSGIIPAHASKLRRILSRLSASKKPNDMNISGWNFHALMGDLKGHYAVSVNGNWRVTFKFENGHAKVVDYQDYH